MGWLTDDLKTDRHDQAVSAAGQGWEGQRRGYDQQYDSQVRQTYPGDEELNAAQANWDAQKAASDQEWDSV